MSTPTVTLNDGNTIPAIGFGAGTALFGGECTKYTLSALNKGYRYLDMAQMYGNSQWVGEAIKQWGGKRDDLFLLTKLGKDKATSDEIHPRTVLEAELKKLGVDHVDLFLIHNPFYTGDRTLSETWKILEDLKKEGLTKSIGVSNFREEDILELEKTWEIPPAVNQIEYHPYVYHPANMQRLAAIHRKHDIKVQAYGPQTPLFRSPGGPLDPVVEGIAKKHGATSGQVLLAWAHQQPGGIVVTTSRDDGRQTEQLEALVKVDLTAAEVEEISEAGKGRFYRHFMAVVWDAAKP